MPKRPSLNSTARGGASRKRPLKLVSRRKTAAPKAVASDHPARWHRPSTRTIVVASGKGGVGKSNFAANLAVALGERGARVLLVDADLAQASLDLLLGLHPRYDLQHVLNGDKSLEEICIDGPSGVTLVPASSGVPELAELDDYRRECLLRGLGNLDHDADVILIDTASGVSRQVTSLCLAADDVVVVTTPEMPAFADAYGLIKLLRQQGLQKPPHLLVNQAGSPEEAAETAHRIRLVSRRFLTLEVESLGYVLFDPAVGRAVRLQQPVLTAFPHAPSSIAFRAIAERLWTPIDPEEGRRPLVTQKLEA
jgi:flagellar biosynthesis protein FlhG